MIIGIFDERDWECIDDILSDVEKEDKSCDMCSEMADILTDMIIDGASEEELSKVIRHSMNVIDIIRKDGKIWKKDTDDSEKSETSTYDNKDTCKNCTDEYSFKPHVHMAWPQDVIENMIADLEEDDDCDYCWQLDDICEKLYEEMGKTETEIERLMKSSGLSSVDAKCLEYNQGVMVGLFKALLLIRKYQDE